MSQITSIKLQKDKTLANIFIDKKYAFGISVEDLVEFDLKIGQELAKKEIRKLKEKGSFHKSLNNLLRFATLRPRSKKEINDWMYRKNLDQKIKNKLFNKLKKLGLLDDERFALWWIEQRLTFRPRSSRMLAAELAQKGIAKDIISQALSSTDIRERQTATKLLRKQLSKWNNLSLQEKRRKAYGYLARKGFDWQIIKDIVDLKVKREVKYNSR